MLIKALVFFEVDHEKGRINYVVKACVNPTLPPFTKATVKMHKEALVSPTLKETVQMVDVEITFQCLKCNFKTDVLEEMQQHSAKH